MIYNHYVNRRGLPAPYVAEFAASVRPEGGGGNYGPNSGGYDQLGFGTLTYTLDPIASAVVPSGLSAVAGDLQLTLSWWGVSGARSYDVKRARSSGGPYETIANLTSNTYTDLNVANGETYYYVVSNPDEGCNSNEVSGTAQILPTIAASSHSGPGGSHSAEKAFDGLLSTKWYTPTPAPGWLQYSFGGRGGLLQTVVGYDLTSANDVPQRDPMDWELEGSLDGVAWQTVDARSGETFSGRLETKRYEINSPAPYAHYRLSISANRGGSSFGIQLSEFQLRFADP
jgi:hypothetical protein